MKYTPESITVLEQNEIFVFGSNEAGKHGAGAARLAWEEFGAEYGIGWGFTGKCYAIPTKDWDIKSLPLDKIQKYVDLFLYNANFFPDKIFLVTKIGCGLAGYTSEQIAPLFAGALSKENIILPKEFVDILQAINAI